jgi:hypothetical protein
MKGREERNVPVGGSRQEYFTGTKGANPPKPTSRGVRLDKLTTYQANRAMLQGLTEIATFAVGIKREVA